MNEFDDVILPDDFEEAPPQAEETFEETPVSEEVDIIEPEQTEEQAEEARQEAIQALKVKYNKEEMEIPFEEAIPLVQKGMNFEKAVERARQEARDAYIAEQGYEWNGKPVTTEAEYNHAVQEKQWLEQMEAKYSDRDLPPEVLEELLESRRFREEQKSQQQAKAEEEKKNAEYNEFFSAFREATGKDFVPGQDEIPAEVWQAHESGVPLKYAFMEHQFKQLQSQVKVLQQNKQNEQKAPVGSLSAHGSQSVESEDEFLKGFNSI